MEIVNGHQFFLNFSKGRLSRDMYATPMIANYTSLELYLKQKKQPLARDFCKGVFFTTF
jgi:hypothetical protein